jgi:hypothetical protein
MVLACQQTMAAILPVLTAEGLWNKPPEPQNTVFAATELLRQQGWCHVLDFEAPVEIDAPACWLAAAAALSAQPVGSTIQLLSQ